MACTNCFLWVVINRALTHTQPKKGHTHQHPSTPSQKKITTHNQPQKGRTYPHPAKKRSAHPSQPTPVKKMVITTHSHLQPAKQRLYIPTHTHPHQAKKGHTYPHPPTASQKKVTPTHTQPKNDHTYTHITERMLCI